MTAFIKRRIGPISAAWRSILLQASPTGTYTPTFTSVLNITASTAYPWNYLRVGNTVILGIRAFIQPTAAAGTVTRVDFSLPIASAFTAETDLQGGGGAATTTQAFFSRADATNDRGQIIFAAQFTTGELFGGVAIYEIK